MISGELYYTLINCNIQTTNARLCFMYAYKELIPNNVNEAPPYNANSGTNSRYYIKDWPINNRNRISFAFQK